LALLSAFAALDRRIFILTIARMVVTLGFAAVLPYLGVTLHLERGVPKSAVGVIWTAANLAGAGMQWIAGEIADRIGRRPVLLGGMVLRTVNLTLLGYFILHDGPIVVIATLVIANSVLRALFEPVASAMVADLATGEQRIAAFSLQRIGVNIGWALGNALMAPAVLLGIRYGTLFYFAAGITLVATVAASAIKETTSSVHVQAPERPPLHLRDLRVYWQDKGFMRFLAAVFCLFLLQAQLYAPLSLYAASHLHLTLGQLSHLYLENGLLVVLLQVPAFYFIRRAGTHRMLVVGSLSYAASYALCGAATSEYHLMICVGLITLAEIVTGPAQQTTAATMAPPDRIGAYAGLFGLAQAMGQALGPLVGTSLLDALPDRITWPLLALCGVAAAMFYRRMKPRAA
jgi:MFS family permease